MRRAKPSHRGRGKPPDPVTAWNDLILVLRIQEHLKKNPSLRRACILVRRDYYPGRSVQGINQAYLALTKPKLYVRPGAVPDSRGFIHAGNWEITNKAFTRLQDLRRRLAFAATLEERAQAGIPPTSAADREMLDWFRELLSALGLPRRPN